MTQSRLVTASFRGLWKGAKLGAIAFVALRLFGIALDYVCDYGFVIQDVRLIANMLLCLPFELFFFAVDGAIFGAILGLLLGFVAAMLQPM
jgi:hypothetical protein